MKRIQEITTSDLKAQLKKLPPPSQTGIDKIWLVMGGIFGSKWTNSMGIDPTNQNAKTWRAVLRGITEQQIEEGLTAFSDTDAKYIPAATEFKALCKRGLDSAEQAAFSARANREERLALPILKSTQETRKKEMDKMRAELKK